MARNYWSQVLAARIRRRRFLAAAGGVAAASAFLAACGSEDEAPPISSGGTSSSDGSGGGATTTASKLTDPTLDLDNAVRGGTLTVRRRADVQHFDTAQPLSSAGVTSWWSWSRIVRLTPGVKQPPSAASISGDIVESWDFSPDKLTMTAKMHPKAHWHNVAPVDGRQVDAEDLAVSWDRWVAQGVLAFNFSTALNPNAPVESVTATDSGTAVIKLSQPVSSILGLLSTAKGTYYIQPKEADQGFDPRTTAIGSGPFMVTEFEPSLRVHYKRHEGHHEADEIFIEDIEEVLLPETATVIAQIQARRLFPGFEDVPQTQILQLKADVPDLNIYLQDPAPPFFTFKFGWDPALGEAAPFRDKRLRQAMSMSIDRDLYIDSMYNTIELGQQGYPIKGYWDTAVQPWTGASESYWLDPKSSEFGPNAKYFQRNLEEAKKLVAAAGYEDGLEVKGTYGDFGRAIYADTAQIVIGFLGEIGISVNFETLRFSGEEFQQKYYLSQGGFPGFAVSPRQASGIYDPVETAFLEYTPSPAAAFTGFFAEGSSSFGEGDPAYTELLRAARSEFDTDRRISMMHDFQRMEAENWYKLDTPGSSDSLRPNWPALRNHQYYHGDLEYVREWLDQKLPPFA